MALDDSGVPGARFDHVGINGALRQEVHLADLLGLFLKNPDELLPDDLPLMLGLVHPGQLQQKPALGIHPDKVQVPFGKSLLYLVPLVLSHKPVIDEDTGKLLADGLGQKGGNH